jgi:endonuclease III
MKTAIIKKITKKDMTKKEKINRMKEYLFTLYPHALTELEYETEFQLLVAIILSAQSTDKQVNKINKNLFQVLKEPKDGEKLGQEKIRDFIKSISFFNNKTRHIFKTSQILVEKYNSKIPNTLEELISLP